MPGKSRFEDGTKQYTVRLTDGAVEFYKARGASLAAGIMAVAAQEDEPMEPEELKPARAESVTPPSPARDEPFSEEPRGPQVIGIVRSLPKVYQGGVDVTPRFKTGKQKGEDSRTRPSRDSQVVDYGDDDAQPLPDYDF